MPCNSCGSANQSKFKAEMVIHFSGLKNLDKPGVWVFPKLLVCLDCGFSHFTVAEKALASIRAHGGTSGLEGPMNPDISPKTHFHIHWISPDVLDWQRHLTRSEAEQAAKQLARRGERYEIEQFDEACVRCQTFVRSAQTLLEGKSTFQTD